MEDDKIKIDIPTNGRFEKCIAEIDLITGNVDLYITPFLSVDYIEFDLVVSDAHN